MGVKFYTRYIGAIRYILMIHDRVVVQVEEVSFTLQLSAKAISDDIRAMQNQVKNRVHNRLLCVNRTRKSLLQLSLNLLTL